MRGLYCTQFASWVARHMVFPRWMEVEVEMDKGACVVVLPRMIVLVLALLMLPSLAHSEDLDDVIRNNPPPKPTTGVLADEIRYNNQIISDLEAQRAAREKEVARNAKEGKSPNRGFRALFGVGYEGYFKSEKHTFDFQMFFEYDWNYFGLSLNLDLGLVGGNSHDHESVGGGALLGNHTYSSNSALVFLGNLNAQVVFSYEDFLFSLGVGPGVAYVDDVFFSVRLSGGIDRVFRKKITHDVSFSFGVGINYIPMFDFQGNEEYAFGFVLHLGL